MTLSDGYINEHQAESGHLVLTSGVRMGRVWSRKLCEERDTISYSFTLKRRG